MHSLAAPLRAASRTSCSVDRKRDGCSDDTDYDADPNGGTSAAAGRERDDDVDQCGDDSHTDDQGGPA